jgi:hypothetical protein
MEKIAIFRAQADAIFSYDRLHLCIECLYKYKSSNTCCTEAGWRGTCFLPPPTLDDERKSEGAGERGRQHHRYRV